MTRRLKAICLGLILRGALALGSEGAAIDTPNCDPLAPCAAPYHTWTFVPVAGTVCGAPGTTAGFFVNPTSWSRKLLIVFSGGGACFHQGDCRARDLNGFDPVAIVNEIEQLASFDRTNAANVFSDYSF